MSKWILAPVAMVAAMVLSGCASDYNTPAIVSWPDPSSKVVILPPPHGQARAVAAVVRPASVPEGWIPPQSIEKKSRWQGIIIHHSATPKGNAAFIDRLHKDRGWEGLGYDFVIDSGNGAPDGAVEVGWRWKEQREGAHTRVTGDYSNFWNEHTIGICLIGNFELQSPSAAQYRSLAKLVSFLQDRYNIPTSKIKKHSDVDATRCPGRNFSMYQLKGMLK
jgi:hypothetical protein